MSEEGVLDTHIDTNTNVVANVEPKIGESDHDKGMIAKADAGLNKSASNDQSNTKLLAGKYKDDTALNSGVINILKLKNPNMSVEDIYLGLEKGTLVPSGTAPDNNTNVDATDGDAGDKGSKKTNSLDTLDPVALAQEREENDGQLLSETRAKIIEEYQIPESTLDTYLAGLNAIEEQFTNKVFDMVGGEDAYSKMIAWVNTLPEFERIAYNEQLATQDINKVAAAVNGMNARFQVIAGTNPELLRPSGGGNADVTGGYASKEEWHADVANPKYGKNPTFRQMVINKLAKSPNI